MTSEMMDGHLWTKLVVASSIYLENKKGYVDSLNVFPVPDGDTGTNMSLTMASAAQAARQNQDGSIAEAAKAVSYGALMGARGNSGVILSQLLAGFAKSTINKAALGGTDIALALAMAVETAYQAVTNPVEGTILTVSREASISAGEEAGQDTATVLSVLTAAHRGAVKALEQTPQLLPVLKQAGVVDAGGQGFVFILEGMIRCLRGEDNVTLTQPTLAAPSPQRIEMVQDQAFKYQYCTEFILKKKDAEINLDKIRGHLSDKGDCLLVVGNSETGKIHIHTNHPGQVLEFCGEMGTLHEIQIHNMFEQSQEMQLKARAVKHLGVISVAMGPGLTDIFKSLGVDIVISGGQTMNPSTQDFVEAINTILAEEVLILPNNGNVILAAQQAANVAGKPARVVGTRSIPQGIAALMAFNPENDLDDNKGKMEETAAQIVTIELTRAVRDAEYNDKTINKGEILGLVNDKLTVTGTSIMEVINELLAGYLRDCSKEDSYELITIYYGEDIQEEEAQDMVETLSATYGNVDFELHYGGQPLYYYLISLE